MGVKKIISILNNSNNPLYFIIGFLFLSIILKITFLTYPFFGLEYEDAFIYADVSRYIGYGYHWSIDPFQTKSCIDGSLNQCYQFSTYSGHYMIFPILVSMFHFIFGYSFNNILIVNFIASLFTLYYFIKILQFLNLNKITVLFATLVYITTPFLNLFNTSGLSETLSSQFILITVLYFFKAYKDKFDFKKTNFWVYIIFVTISFLTKRENLILTFLPAISSVFIYFEPRENWLKLKNVLSIFLIPIFIAVIYNYLAGINEMEIRESQDIGVATFSIANFKTIFPQFIYSYFSIKYYGVTGLLFLLTTLFIPYFIRQFEFRVLLLLTWSYIFLYSVHYRSYYQVHFGQINIFETLRYSSNYLPLACLCLGSLSFSSSHILSRTKANFIALFLTIAFTVLMIFLNLNLRASLSQIEYEERIEPVKETLKLTAAKDYIITDVVSLFRIFANQECNVIDMYSITENRLSYLLTTERMNQIFILRRINDETNIKRYSREFLSKYKLQLVKVKDVSKDYELLKFTSNGFKSKR